MTPAELRASTAEAAPPADLCPALQSLWWQFKGDWQRAHACAQEDTTATGARVHAYLHRVEGDLSNARHWYSRAGRQEQTCSLVEEWERLAAALLLASEKTA